MGNPNIIQKVLLLTRKPLVWGYNCITHYIYAQMVIFTTGPDTPPLHTASDDRAQPVDEGGLGNKFDPCFHGVFLLDIESVGSDFLSCYWYSLYGGGVLYFGTDRRNPLSAGLSQLSPLLVVQSNDCWFNPFFLLIQASFWAGKIPCFCTSFLAMDQNPDTLVNIKIAVLSNRCVSSRLYDKWVLTQSCYTKGWECNKKWTNTLLKTDIGVEKPWKNKTCRSFS